MTSTYSSNPPYFQFNNAIITGGVFNVHARDYKGFEGARTLHSEYMPG